MREADLYPALRAWLEANGYEVHAEVGGCDIAARKGGELVLVEMKTAINLALVLQIVKRQGAEASVYAAVPAPKRHDRRWRELERLLKRLEAGLLLVHLDSVLPRVEVAFHPVPYAQPKAKATTRAFLREMDGRTVSGNVGGGVRRKLLTAYRENALAVAVALEAPEAPEGTSPKAIRLRGGGEKTQTILSGNHYGWFERLGKGLYALTPSGREALKAPEYAEIVAALRKRRGMGAVPTR